MKRFGLGMLMATLLLSSSFPAFVDEISDLKKSVEQLLKRIERLEKNQKELVPSQSVSVDSAPQAISADSSVDPISPKVATEKKVKIGGELRIRTEGIGNQNAITGETDRDGFALLRVRPYLEAKPIDWLSLFIQPQYSRIFGQENATVANGVDIDDFDLHQAYMDILNVGGSPVSFRFGRQELSYGDQRLIGAFGWSTIGRNFDATKVNGIDRLPPTLPS